MTLSDTDRIERLEAATLEVARHLTTMLTRIPHAAAPALGSLRKRAERGPKPRRKARSRDDYANDGDRTDRRAHQG